jgi:hypothetical protein
VLDPALTPSSFGALRGSIRGAVDADGGDLSVEVERPPRDGQDLTDAAPSAQGEGDEVVQHHGRSSPTWLAPGVGVDPAQDVAGVVDAQGVDLARRPRGEGDEAHRVVGDRAVAESQVEHLAEHGARSVRGQTELVHLQERVLQAGGGDLVESQHAQVRDDGSGDYRVVVGDRLRSHRRLRPSLAEPRLVVQPVSGHPLDGPGWLDLVALCSVGAADLALEGAACCALRGGGGGDLSGASVLVAHPGPGPPLAVRQRGEPLLACLSETTVGAPPGAHARSCQRSEAREASESNHAWTASGGYQTRRPMVTYAGP